MTVYIQKAEGHYIFDGCYSADEGAKHKGYKIIYFDDIMEVPARNYNVTMSNNILVVACVEDTALYLSRLGIKEPESINIPLSIDNSNFIKREINVMTLNSFKDFFPNTPMFVKPAYKTKAFASGVNSKRNMLPLLLTDYKGSWDIPVLVSEVVNMVSEYRVYVSKKRGVMGMKHYQGDEFIYPDNQYIYKVVQALIDDPKMPVSFSVDFAVIEPKNNYRYTEVIECQDAWAIGAYGLDGSKYIDFLLERWAQLTKPIKLCTRQ